MTIFISINTGKNTVKSYVVPGSVQEFSLVFPASSEKSSFFGDCNTDWKSSRIFPDIKREDRESEGHGYLWNAALNIRLFPAQKAASHNDFFPWFCAGTNRDP